MAAGFYGLGVRKLPLGPKADGPGLSQAIEANPTIAVALSTAALTLVDRDAVLQAAKRRAGSPLPIWITVEPDTDPSLLMPWTGGEAIACRRIAIPSGGRYRFRNVEGVTQELSGLDMPLAETEIAAFVAPRGTRVREISSAGNGDRTFPVFIKTTVDNVPIFLSCGAARPIAEYVKAAEEAYPRNFTDIAPALMFVKASAAERAWHLPHQYANLTIDDPWLRNPYGYVRYKELLGEMEKYNFHTTIAFIPWNRERSDPEVVSLLRANPNRFSIAIHGNNHDHKEFTDLRLRPLNDQIDDIKESLARMKRFEDLTRLPYDKVMVFPHSIAPAPALAALKAYNFIATINSANAPMDSAMPADFAASARSVTDFFANFASIQRYSIEGTLPEGLIEIESFFGNPLLFYAHHRFFSSGINAFDRLAAQVNARVPNAKWRSLGEIARRQYLVRLRDDSDYDVLAFGSRVSLENTSGRDRVFHFRKRENGVPPIAEVCVDGQRYPYQFQNGYLDMAIAVPKEATREVEITYQNDLSVMPPDSSGSLSVWFFRSASDFRDNFLSRSTAGLWFVRLYYTGGRKALGVAGSVVLVIALILFAKRSRLTSIRRRRERPVPSQDHIDHTAARF